MTTRNLNAASSSLVGASEAPTNFVVQRATEGDFTPCIHSRLSASPPPSSTSYCGGGLETDV